MEKGKAIERPWKMEQHDGLGAIGTEVKDGFQPIFVFDDTSEEIRASAELALKAVNSFDKKIRALLTVLPFESVLPPGVIKEVKEALQN